MSTHELTRIDPLSFGKVNAILGLIVGLIVGTLTLIGSSIVAGLVQSILPQIPPEVGITASTVTMIQQLGFYGLILSLLGGVVVGFIGGAVFAGLYNIVVKLVGGIKYESKEE